MEEILVRLNALGRYTFVPAMRGYLYCLEGGRGSTKLHIVDQGRIEVFGSKAQEVTAFLKGKGENAVVVV